MSKTDIITKIEQIKETLENNSITSTDYETGSDDLYDSKPLHDKDELFGTEGEPSDEAAS